MVGIIAIHKNRTSKRKERRGVSEENKAVALRYLEEAINQRNLDMLDDIFSPKTVDHTAVPGQAPGIEGLKQFFAMMRAGFPDFSASVKDLFAEGDRVAIRFTFRGTHQGEFMGISPTGKQVTMPGIDILRIEEGTILEL
jgi:predicted ester cyclase